MTVMNIQFTDFSNEKSNVRVSGIDLTAANFDAQNTAAAALSVATGVLSIGTLTKRTLTDVLLDSPAIPTNPFAQREMKWLVTYQGAVAGKLYQLEIPAPALTDNLNGNSDEADLGSDDWLAWIAAFESYARAPDDITEAVSVVRAQLVGRNI